METRANIRAHKCLLCICPGQDMISAYFGRIAPIIKPDQWRLTFLTELPRKIGYKRQAHSISTVAPLLELYLFHFRDISFESNGLHKSRRYEKYNDSSIKALKPRLIGLLDRACWPSTVRHSRLHILPLNANV